MAATRQRRSPGGRGRASAPAKKAARKAARPAKKASAAAQNAADAAKPSLLRHPIRRLQLALVLKAAKSILGTVKQAASDAVRGALKAISEPVRGASDKAAELEKSVLNLGFKPRLPIQVAADIVVPLEFAWEEWMTFENFTEGVHRIEQIERKGDRLTGRTGTPLSSEWRAEIVDEREYADFAWRSSKGSDCAGLISFRRIGDRLTRVQLELDVLATGPSEAAALALHLAHRRAEAELRRFKARLEFTDPDVYEAHDESSRNGSANSHKGHNSQNGNHSNKSHNGNKRERD